ncbi:MAG TPA: iron-containing alcohol dehydrogenase, partial [Hypericibacter adhaerens]|uniref:iron-containing alcohol dehydrogenase n=1 Tax=Hypericibacter adhaerens TaxID=2602016 RepID=UPI002C04605B
ADHAPYLIAVPVDAGAIAALGPTITVPTDDGEVSAMFDADFVPDASVCDPDFIAEMSCAQGIAVGMHIAAGGVEAYMARGENPPAEALALAAVRRSIVYLEQAATGHPPPGGTLLMGAAIEAMLAASKGMGAARAIGNAIAGLVSRVIEPGAVSAVMLPVVLDFNAGDPHPAGMRLTDLLSLPFVINLSVYFRQLAQRLALPDSLAELGVDRQMLPRLARRAFRDPNTATNPVAVSEGDYAAMLVRAGGFEERRV